MRTEWPLEVRQGMAQVLANLAERKAQEKEGKSDGDRHGFRSVDSASA